MIIFPQQIFFVVVLCSVHSQTSGDVAEGADRQSGSTPEQDPVARYLSSSTSSPITTSKHINSNSGISSGVNPPVLTPTPQERAKIIPLRIKYPPKGLFKRSQFARLPSASRTLSDSSEKTDAESPAENVKISEQIEPNVVTSTVLLDQSVGTNYSPAQMMPNTSVAANLSSTPSVQHLPNDQLAISTSNESNQELLSGNNKTSVVTEFPKIEESNGNLSETNITTNISSSISNPLSANLFSVDNSSLMLLNGSSSWESIPEVSSVNEAINGSISLPAQLEQHTGSPLDDIDIKKGAPQNSIDLQKLPDSTDQDDHGQNDAQLNHIPLNNVMNSFIGRPKFSSGVKRFHSSRNAPSLIETDQPDTYISIVPDATSEFPGLQFFGESFTPGSFQFDGTIGLWSSSIPILLGNKRLSVNSTGVPSRFPGFYVGSSLMPYKKDGSPREDQTSTDSINIKNKLLGVPVTISSTQSGLSSPATSDSGKALIFPPQKNDSNPDSDQLYLFPVSIRFNIPPGLKFVGKIKYPTVESGVPHTSSRFSKLMSSFPQQPKDEQGADTTSIPAVDQQTKKSLGAIDGTLDILDILHPNHNGDSAFRPNPGVSQRSAISPIITTSGISSLNDKIVDPYHWYPNTAGSISDDTPPDSQNKMGPIFPGYRRTSGIMDGRPAIEPSASGKSMRNWPFNLNPGYLNEIPSDTSEGSGNLMNGNPVMERNFQQNIYGNPSFDFLHPDTKSSTGRIDDPEFLAKIQDSRDEESFNLYSMYPPAQENSRFITDPSSPGESRRIIATPYVDNYNLNSDGNPGQANHIISFPGYSANPASINGKNGPSPVAGVYPTGLSTNYLNPNGENPESLLGTPGIQDGISSSQSGLNGFPNKALRYYYQPVLQYTPKYWYPGELISAESKVAIPAQNSRSSGRNQLPFDGNSNDEKQNLRGLLALNDAPANSKPADHKVLQSQPLRPLTTSFEFEKYPNSENRNGTPINNNGNTKYLYPGSGNQTVSDTDNPQILITNDIPNNKSRTPTYLFPGIGSYSYLYRGMNPKYEKPNNTLPIDGNSTNRQGYNPPGAERSSAGSSEKGGSVMLEKPNNTNTFEYGKSDPNFKNQTKYPDTSSLDGRTINDRANEFTQPGYRIFKPPHILENSKQANSPGMIDALVTKPTDSKTPDWRSMVFKAPNTQSYINPKHFENVNEKSPVFRYPSTPSVSNLVYRTHQPVYIQSPNGGYDYGKPGSGNVIYINPTYNNPSASEISKKDGMPQLIPRTVQSPIVTGYKIPKATNPIFQNPIYVSDDGYLKYGNPENLRNVYPDQTYAVGNLPEEEPNSIFASLTGARRIPSSLITKSLTRRDDKNAEVDPKNPYNEDPEKPGNFIGPNSDGLQKSSFSGFLNQSDLPIPTGSIEDTNSDHNTKIPLTLTLNKAIYDDDKEKDNQISPFSKIGYLPLGGRTGSYPDLEPNVVQLESKIEPKYGIQSPNVYSPIPQHINTASDRDNPIPSMDSTKMNNSEQKPDLEYRLPNQPGLNPHYLFSYPNTMKPNDSTINQNHKPKDELPISTIDLPEIEVNTQNNHNPYKNFLIPQHMNAVSHRSNPKPSILGDAEINRSEGESNLEYHLPSQLGLNQLSYSNQPGKEPLSSNLFGQKSSEYPKTENFGVDGSANILTAQVHYPAERFTGTRDLNYKQPSVSEQPSEGVFITKMVAPPIKAMRASSIAHHHPDSMEVDWTNQNKIHQNQNVSGATAIEPLAGPLLQGDTVGETIVTPTGQKEAVVVVNEETSASQKSDPLHSSTLGRMIYKITPGSSIGSQDFPSARTMTYASEQPIRAGQPQMANSKYIIEHSLPVPLQAETSVEQHQYIQPLTSAVRYSSVYPAAYRQAVHTVETPVDLMNSMIPIIASLPKGMKAGVTRGKYSYTGPDGKMVTTNWYVDETGFHIEGEDNPRIKLSNEETKEPNKKHTGSRSI